VPFGYRLFWVGRKAQDPLLAGADDYAERLARYAPCERIMVRDSDIANEGKDLIARIKPGDFVVAMDERGETPTTAELASKIRTWMRDAKPVVFLIGGADGLAPELKARAQQTMSLSRFTLPHRLAHVVLVEQLYRCHTIIKGEKYHRV
jgi:23S rRNA (pseudouridine1915-N3)-methyltransferase